MGADAFSLMLADIKSKKAKLMKDSIPVAITMLRDSANNLNEQQLKAAASLPDVAEFDGSYAGDYPRPGWNSCREIRALASDELARRARR